MVQEDYLTLFIRSRTSFGNCDIDWAVLAISDRAQLQYMGYSIRQQPKLYRGAFRLSTPVGAVPTAKCAKFQVVRKYYGIKYYFPSKTVQILN